MAHGEGEWVHITDGKKPKIKKWKFLIKRSRAREYSNFFTKTKLSNNTKYEYIFFNDEIIFESKKKVQGFTY